MPQAIHISPIDNVVVALHPIAKGTLVEVDGLAVTALEDIPQGHKMAVKPIKNGENVIKYGFPIGHATADAAPGTWMHTHNVHTNLSGEVEYTYEPAVPEKKTMPVETFEGFVRPDGKVGTRNEIWIIPTVGCVNNTATAIERAAQRFLRPGIDAICAFPHPYGCSQMGDDQEMTRTILADLIRHPNAGGVLVLGLGCENSNIDVLKTYLGTYDPDRIRFLNAQDCEDEITDGITLIEELCDYAAQFHREMLPSSELIIGMKCGGSDGLSGITANPCVGAFSDRLISTGGSTILTEVPEMFGAETLLMNRCESEDVFHQTVHLINDFKEYFQRHGQTIYENPSPGNKKGGISSLEDKSLGCTQKSGQAPIRGVLGYGKRICQKGLHLLSAPGNDLVASTALAASGAQIVLFTTGRGTPFACPVPTVKLSSNSQLAQRKQNWIDFDCGVLTEGRSLEELSEELFSFVLDVASGRQTKSEQAGFHDMAIFKQGVTL